MIVWRDDRRKDSLGLPLRIHWSRVDLSSGAPPVEWPPEPPGHKGLATEIWPEGYRPPAACGTHNARAVTDEPSEVTCWTCRHWHLKSEKGPG